MLQGETSVPDPLELLARMSPRKRRRLAALCLGPLGDPSARFLEVIGAELDSPPRKPDFFGLDIDLDSIYAAFTAAAAFAKAAVPESNLFEDRRGRMEMDGFKLDAVLAYRDGRAGGGEPIELILIQCRNAGKWTGRGSKRMAERLRRVFGDDGNALPRAKARFVALGGERPGRSATAAWPAWMTKEDGTAAWRPFVRAEGEISVVRCDRHGRPRRIGEFWKLG